MKAVPHKRVPEAQVKAHELSGWSTLYKVKYAAADGYTHVAHEMVGPPIPKDELGDLADLLDE